jgi:hypothetical protein
MRYHRYSSLSVIGGRILPHGFVLLLDILLVEMWLDWFRATLTTLSLGDVIAITTGILLANVAAVTIANFNPDLAISDEGLAVKFYFKWLFVPWEDVTSVTRSFASARRKYLIRVRRLTIIHRLVSFSQSGSIQPGFLTSPSIDDYPALMHMIREHVGES